MFRKVLLILCLLALAALIVLPAGSVNAQGVSATTTANVKLRAGSSIKCAAITVVPKGTQVGVSARSADNKWVQVSFNGQSGWVSASYVKLSAGIRTLSVADGACAAAAGGGSGGGSTTGSAGNARLTVINYFGLPLGVLLQGPQTYSMSVPSMGRQTITIVAGTYRMVVGVEGYQTREFNDTFEARKSYEWSFSAE
ncbi:MAG: SH3 domain-containing protein [Anaerolineae bacterium]|nr:SH3 domain-containing protein [Anaerolineae bacterium]